MVIDLTQPIRVQEMVATRSMSHRSNEAVTVCTSSTNSIEATGTESPDRDTRHIKLRPRSHVVQNTGPQTIRRLRVSRIGGTIGCAGNFDNNSCPAAVDDLVRALAVVGSVAVQSSHDQDDGDRALARFIRETDVDWDPISIFAGSVLVWDDFFLDDRVPQRCGFQVYVLLAVEGDSLD